MLKRVHAGLFEEDAGLPIELAVVAQNNNGVESAGFDYDSAVLPPDVVQGRPGCRFTVQNGIRQFRALVVFDPAAPAAARYDLHQVNSAGVLQAVGKSVTKAAVTPLIGFSLDGVVVPVLAPAPVGAARPRKAARPAKAAKKATKKAAKRAPKKVAKKAAKKATKKPANKAAKTVGKRTPAAKRPPRKTAKARSGKGR